MSWERVRQIVTAAGHGYVASVWQDQPRVRPMAFVMTEEGRLWSSTWACSGKLREFAENPRVEVCFLSPEGVHLRIEGRIQTAGGPAEKSRLLALNPRVGRHFRDAQDPNYVLVELVPTRIRWKGPGFGEYAELAELPVHS
ncbi:MAG: pyridoxamine 5'-phosphate oxidase family protein [Myxococcota bacterium]|jgi:uncharacterized pyridoxamine 5'-phosphate oxidase family protein|nr:pyridoxamine 5'-phosphate oxidase family protein [Myxococcota bacterium]